MKPTIIPTIAVQEFYDHLHSLMQRQPANWQAIPADQKALGVSQSDYDYYLTIRQQAALPAPIDIDHEGEPMVYFMGIRVKPLLATNHSPS